MECCPKAVIRTFASQMGGQLLCLGWNQQCWGLRLGNTALCRFKNVGFASFAFHKTHGYECRLGSNVFYVRGTTGERVRVPATVVGLSFLSECIAIGYEHSRNTQLYYDCPVERLTFPIVRATALVYSTCSRHLGVC